MLSRHAPPPHPLPGTQAPPKVRVGARTSGGIPLALRQTARSEIRCSWQAAKDVADVVRRLHTLLEGAVPVLQNALDNLHAGVVDVVDCDEEAVLVEDAEVIEGADAWGRAVKIGACTELGGGVDGRGKSSATYQCA